MREDSLSFLMGTAVFKSTSSPHARHVRCIVAFESMQFGGIERAMPSLLFVPQVYSRIYPDNEHVPHVRTKSSRSNASLEKGCVLRYLQHCSQVSVPITLLFQEHNPTKAAHI